MAFRLYRTTRRLYCQVTTALRTLQVPAAVGGNPTRVWAGRAVRDGAGAARCAAQPDAHQPGVAGAGARCAQPPAAHHPALDPGAAGRHRRGSRPASAARWARAGYLVVDDVVIEKAVRQALALGGVDVLVRQEAQSVRLPYRARVVDQRPDGPLAASRRLSAVASQADVRAGPLSEEDRVGRRDAARAGRRRLPGRLPGGRYRLHRRLRQQDRRAVGPGLGRHPQSRARTVVYRGQRQAVRDLAGALKLKWRPKLGVRARGPAGLCARVGPGTVGRAQERARELRVPGHQRAGHRPQHAGRSASGAAGASRRSSGTPNNWLGWPPASAGWIKPSSAMSRSFS